MCDLAKMKNAQGTSKHLKSSNKTRYHTHSLKAIKSGLLFFLKKRSSTSARNNKVKVTDKFFIRKEFYNQPSFCCHSEIEVLEIGL